MRVVLQGLLILAMSGGLMELAARWVLGYQPLSIDSSVWTEHRTRGWAHEPGGSEVFVRLGFSQPIEINSRGLREREIPYARKPGVQRILAIGDSGLVGFEVAPEEVYTRVVERELRARGVEVEVINAGCRGYGTDQSLLFLREEGMKYRPDVVLYHWASNDPDDNRTVHKAFRRFGKAYFDLADGRTLALRGTPVARFEYDRGIRVGENGELYDPEVPARTRATMWVRDNVAGRSAVATLVVHALMLAPELADRLTEIGSTRRSVIVSEVDRDSSVFRLTAALVAEMKAVAERGGARFQLTGADTSWSRAIRDELGIPELSAWRRFKAAVDDNATILVPFDSHWNRLGHELYGAALAESLVESDLVSRRDPGAGGSF